MRIGSLSRYKTVLHYSLSSPSRSNLETYRMVNQEFVTIPSPKKIGKEDQNEMPTAKIDAATTKTDYIIKMMAEELAIAKPFSKDSGKYIDLYV